MRRCRGLKPSARPSRGSWTARATRTPTRTKWRSATPTRSSGRRSPSSATAGAEAETDTSRETSEKIFRREWTTAEGWRNTRVGLWAWLIQRAGAVLRLIGSAAHLVNPYRRGVQAALLALALLHGLL